MSTPRGIFESFPTQPGSKQESPFAVVPDSPAASPFQAVTAKESPFAAVEEPARNGKIPDRRKSGESPFQITEPKEGFGFEATPSPQAFNASPFEAVTSPPPFEAPPAPSPFSTAPAAAAPAPASSPFAVAQEARPAPAAAPAQAFGSWPAATPAPAASAAAPLTPTQAAIAAFSTPPAPAPPASVFSSPAQAPTPAPGTASHETFSDSSSIRQLELRAIFGVDREMNADEILQRARALPGVRTIARVPAQDINSVEALKGLLNNLGFGGGSLKLYSGSVPIEFIREGGALLAVQTDGGFAPGVRETLMIVARELNRM
ncbi:MAG: hypothetical protein QM680_13940 [Luteolibacter sp.]